MLKQRSCLLVALVALVACACTQPSLSAPELSLGRDSGIPDSLLLIVRAESEGPLGALRPLDSLGNLLGVRGIGIALPEGRVAATLPRLHARLGPTYLVLRTYQGFGYSPDSIGVLHTADHLEALRIRSTSGVNYDISVDSVIVLYRAWHDSFGLGLQGAGPDYLEARILRPPQDYEPLARAVFAACPDVVEQGTNTVAALAEEMRRTRILYCWWD